MNETGAAASVLPNDGGFLTTASLAVIVILAIIVVLAIWWGSRRRAQERAERKTEIQPAVTERAATPAPVVPPVTPPPPPLADTTTGALVEPEPTSPVAPPAEPELAAQGATGRPVTMLKGLGPKVAARLGELGITTVDQLASLSPAEAEALDADLGSFRGRMARDRWIEQAQLLAAGDTERYEATFGKLG